LGYVGLPLAVVLAEAGFKVIGIDRVPEKVAQLNRGESYIQDVPEGRLKAVVESGRLEAAVDYQVVEEVDAVHICVPTPLNKTGDPDLSYILSASRDLLPYLHPDMVVILSSTTYPGSTREIILPLLKEKDELEIGKNFFVAFSPERVDPGREDWTTYNTPRVVGGITEACTEAAAACLGEAVETVVPVSTAEVAEMSKLLENTFRMINIGLVNELALMCDRLDINVWEVIDAAATKPFGFMKFTPGPGLGGHCIPIDPLYLSWKLRGLQYHTRFIDLAAEINADMPRYVVRKVQDALNEHGKSLKGSKILVLGAAYKPDVDDLRESPALDVIEILREKGGDVIYHDPYISSISHNKWHLDRVEDMLDSVAEVSCVLMITDHQGYPYQQIAEQAGLIVDTRNSFAGRGIVEDHIFPL
jgi:UDP-N-acetyl-D-glucosamine dehydrogenase